ETAGNRFFLAMAQAKNKKPEEACKSLDEGIKLMNEPAAETPPLPSVLVQPWQRRLAEQILRQEGEGVRKGAKPGGRGKRRTTRAAGTAGPGSPRDLEPPGTLRNYPRTSANPGFSRGKSRFSDSFLAATPLAVRAGAIHPRAQHADELLH